LLEEAEFVVFDLETTGLSAQTSRICELGAVRVKALELADSFQSLVDPRVRLPEPVARLTGLRERDLRGAPRVAARARRASMPSSTASSPSPVRALSLPTTPASTSGSSSGS
jgi:DNA polymerase III alpha subunit (gram-positive type)